MKITRLAGALGAEITDFDLKTVQTQKDAEILKRLLTEHSVIFFPEQRLNPEEHIALGRLFGNLEGHPNLTNAQKHPEIFEHRSDFPRISCENVYIKNGEVPRVWWRHHVC